MLPSTYAPGRGQMTAMERLFASGTHAESSAAEDVAHERAVLKMVQRELAEADEANLLEEEDMHVFDREPLADHLCLVSCKTCKKPIKESQYVAHAERCRFLGNFDETLLELDGGTGHKKPPRKARKKMMPSQDNHNGVADADRSQSLEADDLIPSESTIAPGTMVDSQAAGSSISGLLRVPKRIMNFAETSGTTNLKVGRPRKTGLVTASEAAAYNERDGAMLTTDGTGAGRNGAGFTEIPLSPSKKYKIKVSHSLSTPEELELICGVASSDSMTCCRRPLTCKIHPDSMKRAVIGRRRPFDWLLQEFKFRRLAEHELAIRCKERHDTVIPVPLATKDYYFRHNHRMRSVIGHLFHETLARASFTASTSPNSVTEQGAQPGMAHHLPLDSAVYDLQQKNWPQVIQEKVVNQKDIGSLVPGICTKPIHSSSQRVEMGYGGSTQLPIPGSSISQQDKFSLGTPSTDIGQSAVLRSRVMQASQLFAISSPGSSLNSIQQSPLGSVHVT